MAYLIQPAKIEDAEAISALVNSAYRGDSSRAGWTTEADYIGGQRTNPEIIKRDFFTPDGRTMLVLREGGLESESRGVRADPSADLVVKPNTANEILACVSLEWLSESTAYLGMLTVKPTLQAKGVGRALLEASENYVKSKGYRSIELSVVHLRDTLIAWYERRGYVRKGETKPFPYGNPEFGMPAVEGLHFVVFKKDL